MRLFVPLKKTTLVTAEALKGEFDHIVARGYAVDNEEMIPGLVCIAAPIRSGNIVVAAISLVVTQDGDSRSPTVYLARLLSAACQIEGQLFKFVDLFEIGRASCREGVCQYV